MPMGPGIIIPVILLAVVVPLGLTWAKKSFKDESDDLGPVGAPSARLTSAALRELPAPPWRVVYEIADDKLDGVAHVLIGPAGVFAIQTSMDPLPVAVAEPDPHDVANAAVVRAGLDDALARCAMESRCLVTVHWGVREADDDPVVDVVTGHVAVDGRSLPAWTDSLGSNVLSPAQVDLAWQTVVTAIGRPDPLA
jgi:hypothetical protein